MPSKRLSRSYSRIVCALFISTALHALLLVTIGLKANSTGIKPVVHTGKLNVRLATAMNGTKIGLRELPQKGESGALVKEIARSRAVPRTQTDSDAGILDFESGLLSYFRLEQLDRRPRVVRDVPIDPDDLGEFATGGRVLMRLWVNASGKVDRLEVIDSDIYKEYLSRVEKHFSAIEFQPGMKDGVGVSVVFDIEVTILPLQ